MRWEAAANMKKTQPPSRFCSHVLSLFLVPAAAFSFACFTHATQGTDMCVRVCVVVVVVWGEGSAHWLLVERVLCRYILDRTGMQKEHGTNMSIHGIGCCRGRRHAALQHQALP